MYDISRRAFIKVSALSACSLFISTSMTGCGNDDNNQDAQTKNYIAVSFDHGVASGDPLADRVILWTRATPRQEDIADDTTFWIDLEVATDAAFNDIVRQESVSTSKAQDFTIKIDLQDLEVGSIYYYRFKSEETMSAVGQTKTLPVGDVSSVKMALFTCANYPNGYFNAYSEAAKLEDLDVSVHVGDYIYEYGMFKDDDGVTPAYATKDAQTIGRILPTNNDTELLTLEDYRKRYALYHTDAGTQAIHKTCAMIVVWDDHEIANDSYKEGAQNHDATEGDFAVRTEVALQAYFEWLPIRPIADKKKIYRSFDFGNLVSLHMLETRLFGRDQQLSYVDYFNQDGTMDVGSFMVDFVDADRKMLGDEQMSWLQHQMGTSTATWQVLGQQVLMGKMNLPAEILPLVAQLENDALDTQTKAAIITQANILFGELAQIKGRILSGDTTVTAEEQSRVSIRLPYNLDAWDGYMAERELVFATAKSLDKNLVVLAGDTHNAWASDLKDIEGNQIGVEFATTSVTSPGLEEYFSITSTQQAIQVESVLGLLIDDLQYANLNNRGFMTVIFTPEEAVSEWHFIDNYHSESYALLDDRYKTLKVKAGVEGRKIEEV